MCYSWWGRKVRHDLATEQQFIGQNSSNWTFMLCNHTTIKLIFKHLLKDIYIYVCMYTYIHTYIYYLLMLPSPSSCCLPQDRPISQETSCGARNSDFTWKASRQRRWQTGVSRNRLTWVRIWVSFILKGKRVWLVIADFLAYDSIFSAAVQAGLVTMFL